MKNRIYFSSLRTLFMHFSKRRRVQFVGIFFLMLFGVLTEMATLGAVLPFLTLLTNPDIAIRYAWIQNIFLSINVNFSDLALLSAILFSIIAIVAGITRILISWSIGKFTFGLAVDLGAEVYNKILHRPYIWHISRNSSEVIAGIQKVNSVTQGIVMQLLQGSVSLLISAGILSTLVIINPFIAITAAFGFIFLYLISVILVKKKIQKNGELISNLDISRLQTIQEGLGSIRDLLLTNTQSIYLAQYYHSDSKMRRAQAENMLLSSTPRFLIESFGMILIAGLAYWLGRIEGGFLEALPFLGALAIAAQRLLPQMQSIYFSWANIVGNQSQLEDVLKFLEAPVCDVYLPGSKPHNQSLELDQNLPLVSFRDVTFQYKSDSCLVVLNNISFEIYSGSWIGIVGKTGSGKSTLLDLLMGLLEPTAGHIEISGQTLRDDNRRAWQSKIAHVPQFIYLSDTSIAENIAFGTYYSEIDMARVRLAAKKAMMSEFIETLPEGYATIIGERGVRLSGGQRQRIGLARALYQNPKVLVLDEATSALDHDTEKSILESLELLGSDITIIMVAHRISTLASTESILVIDDNSSYNWTTYEKYKIEDASSAAIA